MSKPEVLSEEPINMAILKNELDKIKKREKELNFRANKTEEYLQHFVNLKKKEAEELQKKIEGLDVPRLKDIHVHKIIDILPESVEELKVVLQGYTLTVKQENMKRIVETVKEYVKE